MRILISATVLAALLFVSPATAAERNYSVTSFDRIRVEGGYRVRLATGVAPFATASGSPAALDGVAIDVQGRTLVVRVNRSGWGGYPGGARGPVEIMLGTPDLAAAWVNGSGSLAIDRVRGLAFDLAIQGSGAATIDRVEVDQFKLALSGAASARLAGKAARMTAVVRGSSSFDGASLAVKDATIGAEGPAIVKLQVSNAAKVDALGTASVTLTGDPACTVKTQGSAVVEGCKPAN